MSPIENVREQDRLQALRVFGALEAGAEPEFDRIARLAGRLLHAPIGLVTLVDEQGVWCKACIGADLAWISRAQAFCTATIAEPGVTVIPDTTRDQRFANSDLVTGPLGIRFYAGAPIVTPGGFRVGAVCVFDTAMRPDLAADERAMLADLAAIAAEQLESRRRAAALAILQRERRQTARILTRIAGPGTCEEALAIILAELGAFYGASDGRIWKVAEPDPLLQELGRLDAGGKAQPDDLQGGPAPRESLAARLILGGKAGFYSPADQPHDAEHDMASGIIQPVQAGGQQFGITLAFDRHKPDIADIAASVTALIDAAGPLLDRRAGAERTEPKGRDAYFQALFENNPLPMFVYDAATLQSLEVNEAALTTYGCSREAFLGRPVASLAQDGEGASLAQGLATPGCGFSTSVWRYAKGDGSVRRARIASHEIVFGGARRRLVALWDVTEIDQARLALRESHDALQATAAELQARTAELTEVNRRAKLGVWRFPLDGGEVVWSDEIFEVFGRSPQSSAPSAAVAVSWVHPDDRLAVEAAFHAAAATQTKQTFEFRALQPDARARYCLADLHPELTPGGQCVALKGFCQDVTERKETELTLLHAEKLRAIGQLTGGVAHDFNNLLTVTVLSLEEAIEGLPPEDPLLELLQPALHASMRGYELTSQLLSYSRSSRLEPTRIDLAAFFARLLPLLRRSLGDRYTVDVQQAADAGRPFGDVAKLENAVMNLVINARDAMPAGGTVVIETALVTLTEASTGFADAVTPGPYTMIRVSDAGCGIPASVLPRIFEPFFTTKPVGKGSGLGLSMLYGFVKQSGGHVTAASEVGAGTTVSLYLPAKGG